MSSVKNRLAKGKRIELQARKALEAQGHLVESARNVVRWIKRPGQTTLMPISTHHDFFGAWDAVSVYVPSWKTTWWSVTVWEHTADKRKFLQSGPWVDYVDGAILAYVGGTKHRHFKVLRGADGYEWKGETLMVVK